MLAEKVTMTFNITDEQNRMIIYNAMMTGRFRSDILEILLHEGSKITFVENMYLQDPQKNMMGLQACQKLQQINIIPEITPDHKLVYGVQELQNVEDMTDVINTKLARGKKRICTRLEPGLAKYLIWFKNYYQCTTDHVIVKLILNGLALTLFSDDPAYYSEQDLKQFAAIRQYIVHFDPDSHNVVLTKSVPNTQVDFNQFNQIKKIPAGIQSSRGMSKNPTKTNQGDERSLSHYD